MKNTILLLLLLNFLFIGNNKLFATTYYIDPVNGDDETNTGLSTESAWLTFRNIFGYRSDRMPAYAKSLLAGDTIYVMDGTISAIYRPGDDNGAANVTGRPSIMRFDFREGTEAAPIRLMAYPGHHPVIDANYQGDGIIIAFTDWLEISGIDIKRGFSPGEGGNIRMHTSDHVTIHDCEIYDASGPDYNNMSGINCTAASNVEIYNCVFHDNYDRDAVNQQGISTENSTNIVFFRCTGEIKVHDCLFYQTPDALSTVNSGLGIKYKHSTPDPNSTFEVYRNIFRNCKFGSIQSGSANTHFHHNIIIGGNNAIINKDSGGPTHQINQIYEYNTIVNTFAAVDNTVSAPAFNYTPVIDWRDANFPDDPQNVVFRKNIVYHSGTYTSENSVIQMNPYISDELYNIAVPEFFVDSNCYFNSASNLQFSMAGSTGWGALGGYYTWDDWRSATWTNPANSEIINLNYDANSFNEDPAFISVDMTLAKYDSASTAFRPANTKVTNMGAYAGLSVTGIQEKEDVKNSLISSFPNPFTQETKIHYSVPEKTMVQLSVYDIFGKEIALLINEKRDRGDYYVDFDAASYDLSKGVYFCKITMGEKQEVVKIMYMK